MFTFILLTKTYLEASNNYAQFIITKELKQLALCTVDWLFLALAPRAYVHLFVFFFLTEILFIFSVAKMTNERLWPSGSLRAAMRAATRVRILAPHV